MNTEEAERALSAILQPLPLDTFFGALGRTVLHVPGSPGHSRASLFGNDPIETALAAYASHSDRLDCHGVSAALPPPEKRAISGADSFRALIEDYHARDYTVRFPDVVALSPQLQRFARALELLLHQPVDASLFWSKAGAGAIVHYDNRDNLVFQLHGRKRWYLSSDPPGLQNNWPHPDEPPTQLGRHAVVDVGPGDCLYIPRGTPHTVQSETESLHLAVLFEPITLRDALIAAIDHLSDLDRPLRETAIERADRPIGDLAAQLRQALERALASCGSADFVEAALAHRSSRFVGGLASLPKPKAAPVVSAASRVRHTPLAISHCRTVGGRLDLSVPGERIAIHAGVAEELRYIQDTIEFAVRDIPGASSMEVRVALVSRLIAAGFLEHVAAEI